MEVDGTLIGRMAGARYLSTGHSVPQAAWVLSNLYLQGLGSHFKLS